MLPFFRHPLAATARVRSMPNLLDRARLASVTLLAAFAALSLALVGHLAGSGVSVPLPALSGLGKVLTTPNQAADSHAVRGPQGTSPGATGLGGGAVIGANSGLTSGAVRGAGHQGSADSGSPHSNAAGPRQVGVTIGTAGQGQPSTTIPAPTTPSSPGGSSGSGTAGTGTGNETSGTGSGSQAASPANNYGHGSVGATSGTTTNSHSTSSQTSAQSGTAGFDSSGSSNSKTSGKTSSTTSSKTTSSTSSKTTSSTCTKTSSSTKTSTTVSGASGSIIKTPSSKSSVGSKVAGLVPGQLK
jgi:hypothetical protein